MGSGASSPQIQEATQLEQQNQKLAARAYGIGMGGMEGEFSDINSLLAGGGSTTALQQAFGGARAGLTDAAVNKTADEAKRMRQSEAGAIQGGNVGASLASPSDMGTGIAQALYGSRITQAMSALDEQNKLFGMAVGQGQQAGSGSLSAFGNTLGVLPMMQNYNSTYANLMGALNLGTTAYGAANQAGLFAGSSGFGGMFGGGAGDPSGAAGYGNPFAGVTAGSD